jgi:hypothetical protein
MPESRDVAKVAIHAGNRFSTVVGGGCSELLTEERALYRRQSKTCSTSGQPSLQYVLRQQSETVAHLHCQARDEPDRSKNQRRFRRLCSAQTGLPLHCLRLQPVASPAIQPE